MTKLAEMMKKIIGINNRGIVEFSDHPDDKYKFAVCLNCGAKVEGKESKKWMFGHIGCPKPNGEYIKNDLTPKKLKAFMLELVKAVGEELIGEDEEHMTKEEADEVYELNQGNVDYQTILNAGIQGVIDKNQLRKEQREKLKRMIEEVK